MLTKQEKEKLLLSANTSLCNKMHLACEWKYQWCWEGEPPAKNGLMKSRMKFLIDGYWLTAISFDEYLIKITT